MLCKMNNTLRGRTNGTSTLNGYSQPLWAKHTAGPASPGPAAAAAGASLASGADGGARGTGGAPLGNAALGPPAQAALGPTRPRRTGLAPGTTEGPGRGRVRAAQPLGRPLRMRGGSCGGPGAPAHARRGQHRPPGSGGATWRLPPPQRTHRRAGGGSGRRRRLFRGSLRAVLLLLLHGAGGGGGGGGGDGGPSWGGESAGPAPGPWGRPRRCCLRPRRAVGGTLRC